MTIKNAICLTAACLLGALSLFAQQQSDPAVAWKPVEAALGRTGQLQPGDVFKFSMPRKDLTVTKDGTTIAPGLALGSWAAFKKTGDETMLMGDLVLTEDEIEPVMLKLQQEGIEQTSIHNHLVGEQPHIVYMHIAGHGDAVQLAKSLAAALALTKTPIPAAGAASTSGTPAPIAIDSAAIETILGYKGKINGGILQFSIPRAEKITDAGMEVPPSMGTATAVNFQPTGNGRAAISGDFVLVTSEVKPVLHALRAHGIDVTALHNHMLNDQPHLYFVHFWANDDAGKLAQGLRAALDQTNSKKPEQK